MTTATYLVDGVLYEAVTLPSCPACGSTASRCHRPSGHDATDWHIAREYALAPLIGMADWRAPQPVLFE